MKTLYISILCGLCACCLFFSCKDDNLRVVYPHSTPVIGSAAVSPTTFTYGDTVIFTATVSDPETPLSTLELQIVVNDKVLVTESIRTSGTEASVADTFQIPFVSELPHNGEIEVNMTLINVEGDETTGSVSGITGQREYFDRLYVVMEDTILTLLPQEENPDLYEIDDLAFTNSITYKVATRLTGENEIDYSGYVWGLEGDEIALVEDETGGDITSTDASLRRINSIIFDTYYFTASITGTATDESGLYSSDFGNTTVSGEAFITSARTLTNGRGLKLYEDFVDDEIVFNVDYFTRISSDSVVFTGETGNYNLYYSPTRKFMLVNPVSQSFPSLLYACGMGLGYPSKVQPAATTSWGFDNVLQCIIFKQVDDNTYQGTVYFDASQANFKFFESTGWANEKLSDDYTLPDIIESATAHGATDGNWYAAGNAVSGNYRITINLSTKEVTATAVTLP